MQVRETSEDFIKKNLLNNEVSQFHLEDCTSLPPSPKKNSRRLRSLGGALRRILSTIREIKKKPNTILSNSDIIKELKCYVILGNQAELENTKRTVLTNTFEIRQNWKILKEQY